MTATQPETVESPSEPVGDPAAIELGDKYLDMQARGGTGSRADNLNVTSIWLLSTPFEEAAPDNLLPLPYDELPEDLPTARRLVLRVNNVTGHGENVIVLVHVDERGEVLARRVDSDEPMKTALNIVCRRIVAPPPVAANDNAPRLNPFNPRQAEGLLQAIAEWMSETNRLPAPEFSMLAAIALVSALYGRRVLGPTNAGINLYLAGIATTGFGKEHPLKALQVLAHDCGMGWLIGPGEVTSGAAIEKIVRRRPSFVMPWDELGAVLQSVNGRSASTWARTIRKVLLELFSKSDSVWTGKEYADANSDSSADPVFCPTVSLMGMSTPETFYAGLTEESLTDGFLSRLLVISATNRPKAQDAASFVTPQHLKDEVKRCVEALPSGGNLAEAGFRNPAARPAMYAVPWEDDFVKDYWHAIEEWQNTQIDQGRMNEISGRYALQTIKLATIRAVSRSPADPKIGVDDIDWGRAIVHKSVAYIESGIETHMAGSVFEELVNAISNALKSTPDGRLSMAVLVRKKGVSKADERQVKMAVDRLYERGDIYKPELASGGVRIILRPQEA